MTREYREYAKSRIEYLLKISRLDERDKEALEAAIQALSQEPCDDVVSRQAVLNAIEHEDKWLLAAKGHNGLTEIAFSGLKARVDALPSVTQKTGKWIRVTDKTGRLVWECDKCSWQQRFNTNFCPNCGAKMVEPQESEVAGGHKEKEMPWYLSIFNTELLKQKGHWITDDVWRDIAYNTEFLEFLYNHINPNDMEHYRQMFEMKDAVAVNGAEKESSDACSN